MLDQSATTHASSVTVSPGDIDAFSKFLSAVTSDIDDLATELTSLISATDLGEYDKSAAATTRYENAATRHRDHAAALAARADKLVTATSNLARQYLDLEDLNASSASAVTSYLDAEA